MKWLTCAWVAMVVGCGGAPPTTGPAPIENRTATSIGPGPIPDGWYACQMEVDSWVYAFFACEVRVDGNAHVLEKVEGQMRFKGVIDALAGGGSGFAFSGERWCTFSDTCRYPATATFIPADHGGWEGRFAPVEIPDGEGTTTTGEVRVYLLPESTMASLGGVRYGGGHGVGGWDSAGRYPIEVPR